MATLLRPWSCDAKDPRDDEFWPDSRPDSHNGVETEPLHSRVHDLRYVSTPGRIWGWIVLSFNLVSAILFVMLQYSEDITEVDGPFKVATTHDSNSIDTQVVKAALFGITFIYVIDFLLRITAASDRFSFMFSMHTNPGPLKWIPIPTLDAFDLASIVCVQVSFFVSRHQYDQVTASYDLSLFTVVRIFYVIEAVTLLQSLAHQKSKFVSNLPRIKKVMLNTGLTALSIIFVGAALFMHIENWSVKRDTKLEYFECVYFIVTTMTTVGYGDISPTSNLAQFFTICLMLYLIIVLFPQITNAADLIGEITPYNSKPAEYSAQPVILYKYGSNFNVEMVDKFAVELFHPDQPQQVSLCIVSTQPPDIDLQIYLSKPRTDNITFIQGSLMDDNTCYRAGVEYAKACILMHNNDCPVQEMLLQDESLCILATRLRQYTDDISKQNKFTQDPARIILNLNHTFNACYFTQSFYGALPSASCRQQKEDREQVQKTEVVSIRELQLAAMAKGVVCPGFHPFMANLTAHVEGLEPEDIASYEGEQWLKEYFDGAAHECYAIEQEHAKRLIEKMTKHQVSLPYVAAKLFDAKRSMLVQLGPHSTNVTGEETHCTSAECKMKLFAYSHDNVDEAMKYLGIFWDNDADGVKKQKKWDAAARKAGEQVLEFSEINNSGLFAEGHIDQLAPQSNNESKVGVASSFLVRQASRGPMIASNDLARVRGTPLSKAAITDTLKLAFDQAGLEMSFDKLEKFSERHVVQDPMIRFEDPDDQLMQEPYSEVLMSLKRHTILIGGHVEHAPHFVRVLRTVDIPPEQQMPIVIVASHTGSKCIGKLLNMFREVYIVQIPDEDTGYLSMKTLMGLNLNEAKNVLLNANAAGDEAETALLDHHHMSLRTLIRNANPKASVIFEVEDYEQSRYFVRGSDECNAWSEEQGLNTNCWAAMNKKWVKRDAIVNRAAVVASGQIVEEDMFVPILTSCVHQSSDIQLLHSLLGGSKHDFSLISVDMPAEFVGRTQLYLVCAFAVQDRIPIALFRINDQDGQQYIYTNPAQDTVLRASDKIYVTINHLNSEPFVDANPVRDTWGGEDDVPALSPRALNGLGGVSIQMLSSVGSEKEEVQL